jgi:hypothetical protein
MSITYTDTCKALKYEVRDTWQWAAKGALRQHVAATSLSNKPMLLLGLLLLLLLIDCQHTPVSTSTSLRTFCTTPPWFTQHCCCCCCYNLAMQLQ